MPDTAESGFDYGLDPAELQITANPEIDAIEIEIIEFGTMVLSPSSAIGLILKLVAALDQLPGNQPRPHDGAGPLSASF
jgi:hypothetical protein